MFAWMWFRWLVYFALIVFVINLSGCALYMLSHPEKYTPEQMKAFNEMGLDTYFCFQIGGPPPAGAAYLVLWPKNKPMPQMRFGPQCFPASQ